MRSWYPQKCSHTQQTHTHTHTHTHACTQTYIYIYIHIYIHICNNQVVIYHVFFIFKEFIKNKNKYIKSLHKLQHIIN